MRARELLEQIQVTRAKLALNSDIAICNLSGTYVMSGDLAKALALQHEASKLSRHANSDDNLTFFELRFAAIYFCAGDNRQAAEHLVTAENRARQTNRVTMLEPALTLRAYLALREDDASAAATLAEAAIASAKDARDLYGVARAKTALGNARLAQDRHSDALTEFEAAFHYFERNGLPIRAIEPLTGMLSVALRTNADADVKLICDMIIGKIEAHGAPANFDPIAILNTLLDGLARSAAPSHVQARWLAFARDVFGKRRNGVWTEPRLRAHFDTIPSHRTMIARLH
jgi:tetratricopeptide (TPR) repeat protein